MPAVPPARWPGLAAVAAGLLALVATGPSVGQDPARPGRAELPPGKLNPLPGGIEQPPARPDQPAGPPAQPANPVVPPGMPPGPVGRPADPAAINAAIEAGVRYLRASQNPLGFWESKAAGAERWMAGYTALAGLTLIECGVPANDPGIQRAAEIVRRNVIPYPNPNPKVKQDVLDDTYEVSLAILFLDRVGDKKDERLIQVLAARLIAGQAGSGGWGYKVPRLSETDAKQVLPALRKMSPPAAPNTPSPRERPGRLGLCIKASEDLSGKAVPPHDPVKARKDALAGVAPAFKQWPVFQDANQFQPTDDPPERRHQVTAPTTDNSNTHFAMLALWAARKHDVPADRSLTLLARRFRASNKGSGGWAYDFVRGGSEKATPAMTSVALMGVAIGHVIDPDAALKPEDDPLVLGAFRWLARYIGEPAGRIDGRPSPKDARGLYFLWAVERVAVLYDVAKLAQKDWYLWGAEILLGHQGADGSWPEDGGYHGQHPVLNTCFALLFLKRANLTPDLSRRLVVDTTALTAKVDSKPDTSPVVPESPPQPSEVAEEIPPPREKAETPVAAAAVKPSAEPTAETASAPAPVKKGFPWGLVVLILIALVGVGFCLFLLLARKRAEEEKPKKKKKKLKAKAAD
jgi:hypothetical protein